MPEHNITHIIDETIAGIKYVFTEKFYLLTCATIAGYAHKVNEKLFLLV